MDILNMINQYLKDNKSDEELASEFLSLLKRGETIDKIAKQYELEPSKIHETLRKSGYIFNTATSHWEKSESLPTQEDHASTYIEDSSESEENTTKTANIDLEYVVTLLNNGKSLDEVCQQYSSSMIDMKNMLTLNGYYYYPFLERWYKKNEEELADYLAQKTNKTMSLYDLSKKFFISNKQRISFVNKVESLFKNNNYKFDYDEKRWIKATDMIKNSPESNKIENPNITNNLTNQTSVSNDSNNTYNQALPIPISLANMLNNGLSLNAISKQYHVSPSVIESTLNNNGFHYYSFLNHWTKKDADNFSEELAILLNKATNIKILFNRFNISPQKQDECLSEIKNFLQSQGYSFSITKDTWEKSINAKQLPLIVSELNKTNSFKKVAKKYKMSDFTLRQLLKNNGYHYYGILNIWTNKSDKKVLEEIVEQLSNETLTLTQLAERNIDIEKLKQALVREGIQYEKNATETESQEIQKPIEELENQENQKALENTENHENSAVQEPQQPLLQSQFDEEEINSLKEMIQDWKNKKKEEQSLQCYPVELSIYLPANLLAQITNLSEREGISRSKIISKALQEYLKK